MNIEKRSIILIASLFFIFIVLEWNIFNLTIIKHQDSELNSPSSLKVNLVRGTIYSSTHDALAISFPFYSIYMDPSKTDKNHFKDYVQFLSFFGFEENQAVSVLMSNKKFRWISRMLPKETFNTLQKNPLFKLPGIYSLKEYKRVYPYKHTASSIIGFNNLDGKGIAGIEYSLDSYLKKSIFNKKKGELMGFDIILTLNLNLQQKVEQIVKNVSQKLSPKSISAIIMEADTGKILSMVSYPNFDPNIYNKYSDPQIFKNTTISSVDEPGSTFKPLVMTYLFDQDILHESDIFYSHGKDVIEGFTIKEAMSIPLGRLNPRQILIKSSNIGMAKASKPLSKTDLYNLLVDLGLGQETNLNLPGEEKGLIRTPTQMTHRSKLAIPFGQEIGVTPIQLVQGFTAIANEGILTHPKIIDHLEYQGKKVSSNVFPILPGKSALYSKKNSNRILSYMRSVVTDGGAHNLNVPGEWIAGKTGTAQIFDVKARAYNKINTSIIAIYKNKQSKKKYIIYGVIREPNVNERHAWGGTLAAPMVHDFILALIKNLKNQSLLPSKKEKEKTQ